jgi:hypothetical protein
MTAFHTHTTNPRQIHHESIMVVGKPISYYEAKVKNRRDAGCYKLLLTWLQRIVFFHQLNECRRLLNFATEAGELFFQLIAQIV